MNFIFSTYLVLRVWFDPKTKPKDIQKSEGYCYQWCTTSNLPIQK